MYKGTVQVLLQSTVWRDVGFTFTEHLWLACAFALFLLYSTGCCVIEFHKILSNPNALQNQRTAQTVRNLKPFLSSSLKFKIYFPTVPCPTWQEVQIFWNLVWSTRCFEK